MITLDFSRESGQLLDVIEFDGDMSISPEMPSEITNYPVESGSTFSDSIIRKPRIWTCSHKVTDTPTKIDIQPPAPTNDIDDSRSIQVWNRLVQAVQNRQTCRLITDLEIINMVGIENVKATETADTQGGLDLEITYKEIQVATVQRAKIRLKRKAHAGLRKNRGQQSPINSTRAVSDVNGKLLGWQDANGFHPAPAPVEPLTGQVDEAPAFGTQADIPPEAPTDNRTDDGHGGGPSSNLDQGDD